MLAKGISLVLHKEPSPRAMISLSVTMKRRMVDFDIQFDIQRAQLGQATSDSRDWFLLNSKICGVHLVRFMTTSPLAAKFSDKFTTVSL